MRDQIKCKYTFQLVNDGREIFEFQVQALKRNQELIFWQIKQA